MNRNDFLTFLDTLLPEENSLITSIRKEGEKRNVPQIKADTSSFLQMLLRIIKPKSILEIGSGIGYSAFLMAEQCPDAEIISIELDAGRCSTARRFAGENERRIRFLEGDAAECLSTLKEPFDFVFLDGPKAQYPVYWPQIKRLLSQGGLMAADNILQEGTILESRFSIPRRERTIHERMRDFVSTVFGDKDFSAALLAVGDGLLLARKGD